jgi:hypothetical protein
MSEQQPTIWYRANNNKIEEITVVRVTDKMITYVAHGREWRASKESLYDKYFPSRDEAKAFLIEHWSKRVKSLEEDLEHARAKLEQVGAL